MDEALGPAWQLFRRAEWAAARDAFAAVLEETPGDPEALDGLGQALWWLGEQDSGIDRRRELRGKQLGGAGRRGASEAISPGGASNRV